MPKKKVRANGEGSIYIQKKDKNGKATMWAASYTDNAGVRRTVYGKTQQIVKDKLKEAIRESDKGLSMDKSKILFVDWIDEWLEVYVKPTVRKSTYANYYQMLNDYVKPAFQKVLLKDVRPDMLQKLLNKLAISGSIKYGTGLSRNTLISIKTRLYGALNQAVMDGIINQNPVERVKLPSVSKTEKRILTVEEQERLERALLKSDNKLAFGIYLALYTGLRIGELVGLKASDFDFDKRELKVQRIIGRVRIPGEKRTEVIVGKVKTAKGERVIPLPQFIIDMLAEYLEKTREERETIKYVNALNQDEIAKWVDEEYLFISPYGKPFEHVVFRNFLTDILNDNGIEKIHVHALRHTFATRCIEQGFDVRSLAEILGHADVKMTLNIYTHALEEQKRTNMEKLKPMVSFDEKEAH